MGADVAAEEQFGPYLVYERLGVGGMATVHRALERGIEGFERVVALKRLLPHLAADASFIKSFVREAKLASLLNHGNIVQIFELGRVGSEYFISMEYIAGHDIRRILRHARKVSGPPPIHVTVGLLLQLCEALNYAHHKVDDAGAPLGLVHRDVSPSNVLVTPAGQVKVIDFGIAKAQSVQLRTQTGRVKGKLAYMAPEALAGKDLDARSDLFALGVIAHELLTARPLFATKNEYQTLMKVQRGEIMPPSTFNQACPAELDAIVLRALARDPDDRFHHASDMRDELHAMRRPYNLQTADRDIAMWLEWAFSLESPGGNFTATHSFDPSASAADALSPANQRKPKRAEDEESIDIAWGGLDEHNNGAPVLLDDVPDVSGKHLGTSASALGAEVRLDFDDLVDDIPSSQPSHGVRPPLGAPRASSAAATASLLGRPHPRTRPPTPAAHVRSQTIPPPIGREPSNATRLPSGIAATGGGRGLPPRVRTITIPPIAGGPAAPSTRPSLAPPPPAAALGTPSPPRQTGSHPRVPSPTTPPAFASQPAMQADGLATAAAAPVPGTQPGLPPVVAAAVQRPRMLPSASTPPRGVPAGSSPPFPRQDTVQGAGMGPAFGDNMPTERTPSLGTAAAIRPPPRPIVPRPSAEDFASPSDTVPSMPAMPSSEPIVRFRAPTIPPPGDPPTTPMAGPITGARDTLLSLPPIRNSTGAVTTPFGQIRGSAGAATTPLRASGAPPHGAPPPARTSGAIPITGGSASGRSRPSTAAPLDPPPPGPAPTSADSAAPLAPATPAEPADGVTVSSRSARQRLITPATALFADPDPSDAPDEPTGAPEASMAGLRPPASRLSTNLSPKPSTGTDATGPQRRTRRRALSLIATSIIIGVAVAGVTLYLTRPHQTRSQPSAAPTIPVANTGGLLKLSIVPTDATIAIAGRVSHAGSPWNIELAPGVHQIEVHRDGYKTWLTQADMIAGQTQSLSIMLEPLDPAVIANATLVGEPPPGYEVVIDGTPLATGAPIRQSVAVGPHAIVLRKDGAEIWKTELDVRASATYDLGPILTPHALRAEPAVAPGTAGDPAPATTPNLPADGSAARPIASGGGPTPGMAATAPADTGTTAGSGISAGSGATTGSKLGEITPMPTPPVPPPPTPAAAEVLVPASAVSKRAGAPPSVSSIGASQLPATISAKLCIDDVGHVTSAAMVTQLRGDASAEIVDALRTWQYAPYKAGGVARAACFVVSFRAK